MAHAPENLASHPGRLRIKLDCFGSLWFTSGVTSAIDPLPSDLASAQAMILAERAARIVAEAKAAEASAVRQGLTLEIERLKLEIARLRRERFGPSAERFARLEQLELSLEDLE